MTKIILLLSFFCSFLFSHAQNADSSSAKVAVIVTDMKGKVQRGEEVLFLVKKNPGNIPVVLMQLAKHQLGCLQAITISSN